MDTLPSSIDDALLPHNLADENTTDPALLNDHNNHHIGVLEQDLGPEHVQAPVVGDRYVSHEQVRLMLDNYARHEGFAVSVRASNKINYRWQCVHSGKYRSTRKGSGRDVTLVSGAAGQEADMASPQQGLFATGAQVSRPTGTGPTGRTRRQATKRTNCPWLVRAGMDDENLWKITKAVLEHNHALSPSNPDVYHQNRAMTHDQSRSARKKASSAHQDETTVLRVPSPVPGLPLDQSAMVDSEQNASHEVYTGYHLNMPGLPVNAYMNGYNAASFSADGQVESAASTLRIEVLTKQDFDAQGLHYATYVPFTKEATTQTDAS